MTEPTKPAPFTLPVFGPGAWFVAVEGEPVSVSKGEVRVWRNGKPEPFSAESAIKGDDIDEARFRELVAAQSASTPVDLLTIPLDQFADLATAAIVANLRRKTAEPPAALSQAELLDAARGALLSRFRLEPCDMPSPRPYGMEGGYVCFLIVDETNDRFGASQYVAVNRSTGEAVVFESSE
jgi:hypothetical protein